MRRPLFLFFCWWCVQAWSCLSSEGRDLVSYQTGDVAEADIVTPLALDVADPVATAALQSAKARQYPAIFRSFPEATNLMAQTFLAEFARSQSQFLGEMTNEFHAAVLDERTIESDEFGRLVTAFGVEHRDFPVTDELAGEWARGGDGQRIRAMVLATLEWAVSRPVRPDELPAGMYADDAVRLVPVTNVDQKLSFETVQQAPVISAATMTTVSNAQVFFRREFPRKQQLFARALAALIQPNCFPDAPYTELTRGTAVYQLVVSDHFDAGDTIVRKGDKIDAKAKAAIAALQEKMAENARKPDSSPDAPPTLPAHLQPPGAKLMTNAATATAPARQPAPASVPVMAKAPESAIAISKSNPSATNGRHIGLIVALAGFSAAWFLVAWWQYTKQRKSGPLATAASQVPLPLPLPLTEADKDNLTPQVAQAVREAVQQELAMQRRELLAAQQTATSEITALVQRLDELQVPMQERLQTYESRIQMLEKELALRNEENRELLRMKIEMTARQLEMERAGSFTKTITA